MSRADWVIISKYIAAVALIAGVLVYATAYFSDLPVEWAATAHAIIVVFYFGLVALFGAGSVLEMAVLAGVLSILASVAMPAYHDHTIRETVVEVIIVGHAVGAALDRHWAGTKSHPKSIDQLGVFIPRTKVANVSIESGTSFTVTLATPAVAGKQLAFVASTSNGVRSWKCTSKNLDRRYRPSGCRDDFKG